MKTHDYLMTREQALVRLSTDPEFRSCDAWDVEQIYRLTGSKKALRLLRRRYPEALDPEASK